ncbi:thioredoxin [Runella sp. MFBS21]|uniref:thioredoxin n=1 Tax=Runella sp. MFBS21 TaxID=3034018 RepID=UPI0023F6F33F|nr:thioredoxin [Runella sp. MFBS21]MDF7821749.1 thioredoxin [Runella sp. MFBS21]
MGKALEITDANFAEVVENSDKPVLVDFWAEWCGPCRMVGPVVEKIAEAYEGQAVVGKVDVDMNPETAMKFGIRSIPTLLFFKNGQLVDRVVGAVPQVTLEDKLKAQIAVEA